MARVIGAVSVSTNYEVTVKKPLDARSLVKTYEDLIDRSNWLSAAGSPICYNGMLVAVANTSDTSKNGLYMLFDVNCTTNLKTPDVTVETNWIKIGETSDVSGFAERLETIEENLSQLTNNVNELDARVNALEADRTHSYGYRKDFPLVGEVNHLYIAADTKRTYVFSGGSYLPIADQFDYDDHDLDPETPEVRIIYGGSAD